MKVSPQIVHQDFLMLIYAVDAQAFLEQQWIRTHNTVC